MRAGVQKIGGGTHDRNEFLMAMVTGYANIGQSTATDFIMTTDFLSYGRREDQDQGIAELVTRMVEEKRKYWGTTQVPPERWPGPTLILASPSPDRAPRAWSVNLNGADVETTEILESPQIRLEGSYDEVFALLYGFHAELVQGLYRPRFFGHRHALLSSLLQCHPITSHLRW